MSEAMDHAPGQTLTHTPTHAPGRGPFQAAERVQLNDARGRGHSIYLEVGGLVHSHRGTISHDDIIGQPEGCVIKAADGTQFQVLRPTLVDFILTMPRGAQIVYPKDSATIVMEGDIFPGARVIEAGVGSGALTLALLQAVGTQGSLHSIERREEFADIASANVEMWNRGKHPAWQLSIGDLSEVLKQKVEDHSVDRVVLDMLAPWENLEEVARTLTPGGVLTCYVASVTQMSRLVEDLRKTGDFMRLRSQEVVVRPWHVEGLAIRPEHRIVGHTGFIITARRVAPGVKALTLQTEESSLDQKTPDDAPWLDPEQSWEELEKQGSTISKKRLRRIGREAQARVEQVKQTQGKKAHDE
ncbi:MAG: tRNA (adenine-N1)-methyltransferase [Actinomycetaceae bacterium]|nr:tRNA (adenine-N1)-methyltransferase [Actinomycetaceae bacterium]